MPARDDGHGRAGAPAPALPTFDPGFSTPAMTQVFSPAARVAAWCRVEAALAAASAAAGLVEPDAAEAIATACAAGVEDPAAIAAAGWELGTPVLALLDVLRSRLDAPAAAALHRGATTQDIVDSGLQLQVGDAIEAVQADLVPTCVRLRDLAVAYRDVATTGWTFLQPARPTTVGRRVAGWLDPAVHHVAGLRDAHARRRLQLGGPTGTLADLGDHGIAVAERMGTELGLVVPTVPWHTDRTPLAELVGLLGHLARTMATIGTDLALLAHDGVATMRAGGSSSMPGKRNPVDAIRAVAAAEACAGAASIVTRGRPHELERGIGGWHAEWLAVPLAFHTCAAAVAAIRRAAESLAFDPAAQAPPDAAATIAAAGVFVDRVVATCDTQVPA